MTILRRRSTSSRNRAITIDGLPRPADYEGPSGQVSELLFLVRERIEAHRRAGSIDFATVGILADLVDAQMDDVRECTLIERMEHVRLQRHLMSVATADLTAKTVALQHARRETARLQQLCEAAYAEVTGFAVPDVTGSAHPLTDAPIGLT